MKSVQVIRDILQQQKDELRREYGIRELGIFGSVVRGEQRADSDIDVLVSLEPSIGLLKFVHLENHLSDLLGMKVDLVMKDALRPKIGEHILRELISI